MQTNPRCLLVNPWVYDFKAFDFWNKPVGLLIVAQILKSHRFEIDFIDCMDRRGPYFGSSTRTDKFGRGKYYWEEVPKPGIFKSVSRRYKRYGIPKDLFIEILKKIPCPDIIFVTSSMTYWYPGVFEAIRLLKEQFPQVRLVLGGIYATLCEGHARRYSGADIVFTGPAEGRLVGLLTQLGLIEQPQKNLAIIPDFSVYKELNYGVIITSRGCPFNCTYCATRFLSPEFQVIPNNLIINQLDYFSKRTQNIALFDDALLCNKEFSKILGMIIEKNYNFNFHTSNGLHCRFIDEKIARTMFQAGFKTMYLSLETINPQAQRITGNKVTTREFVDAVRLLKKLGYPRDAIHTYLLFGIPGQALQEVVDGIKLCHSLGVQPHLCEFSPIPHTQEFSRTGFDEKTDPLYHNNLFYTWYYPQPRLDLYRKIKSLLV